MYVAPKLVAQHAVIVVPVSAEDCRSLERRIAYYESCPVELPEIHSIADIVASKLDAQEDIEKELKAKQAASAFGFARCPRAFLTFLNQWILISGY